MTTKSFTAKTVQEIIKKLKTVADVTKYTSTRIYVGHISTIQDYVLPAITIELQNSEGQAIDAAEMETVDVEVDFWLSNAGENANTWDDVMECFAAAKHELHNNGGWDDTVGINILMIENISIGQQLYEHDTKIMHFPSRFRIRGTLQ